MTVALAALVAFAIAAPHVLRLERASPSLAASIWLGALALRALTAVFCALFVVLYLPATELFRLITHWCWHAVIPLVATHLPLNGHALGDVALIAPAFVLAASACWVAVGLWRAGRRVRLLLRRAVVGPGPAESLVLADGDVLVAAAGLRRPRVVISAGALMTFDDEELAASLEHEHGHIVRRHRYVLVFAELCRSLARFLPGTRTAARELVFHLERDADGYAVARTNDPAALASAICKATEREPFGAPALRALATAMVVLVTLSAAALPAAAHAGYRTAGSASTVHPCPD